LKELSFLENVLEWHGLCIFNKETYAEKATKAQKIYRWTKRKKKRRAKGNKRGTAYH
jgi:hypothetical protein